MFLIQILGRRNKQLSAKTTERLGEIVTKELADPTNTCLVVAVGRTDNAVMPYVWIRRNDDTDEWEGELGDSIKLGIEDGLITEKDPVQLVSLGQAVEQGWATVEDDGVGPVVTVHAKSTPPKQNKLTNEEKMLESKRMIDELFSNLREE